MSKTVIIGGVAGGASCAARLRRLREDEEIIVFEKGNYISFANCGLPYYVGNVISSRNALLLQSPELMKKRFNIQVRVNSEAVKINREEKTVDIKTADGTIYKETYDVLVLATGSSPFIPDIEGIDSTRIRTIWNVNDTDEIKKLSEDEDIRSVTVVGGGFIGMEMTENFIALGKTVNLIEGSDHVMNNFDPEMSLIMEKELQNKGVNLYLGQSITSFNETDGQIISSTSAGNKIGSDLVIMSIGVRANSRLAKDAGLMINEKGGIIVDDDLKTSDPCIYAVGDVIEVTNPVFDEKTMIPLAGPANKQGRMAADNIAGYSQQYAGTQGTFIAKIFELSCAATGYNEKQLMKKGLIKGKDYETATISQNSHAGYYPGSSPMMMKLLFDRNTEKILGCQIVGKDGVDKRIDVISTAMRLKAKASDLKGLELAYAPMYSSAKDPVNMLGFVSENVVRGLERFAEWNELELHPEKICIDVREVPEVEAYSIPGAVNIPLGTLRDHLDELEKDREYVIMCAAGVRAHTASRILLQHGFSKVSIYPGGARFYRLTH